MSASALRGFGVRSSAEGDGVLRAVAWLGRSPESFVPGGAAGEGTPLPAGAPAGLRFDARALYAELDGHGWRRGCRGQRSRRRAAQGAPRP
ncbi:MAG TPA: hypothetical protein VJ725_24600 [Thermoanaerobaculia bacterium]|nr:hypothetical protein [Thermoanaerobaculia bacterium]